ncbi:hypothetical protein B0H13DRAFT_2306405 [Mycena leptocephala]|nr:hypothetical protein B0H13DRAFT_2306405 [Mycena leptocephala]
MPIPAFKLHSCFAQKHIHNFSLRFIFEHLCALPLFLLYSNTRQVRACPQANTDRERTRLFAARTRTDDTSTPNAPLQSHTSILFAGLSNCPGAPRLESLEHLHPSPLDFVPDPFDSVDKIWRFADANEIVDLLASHIAAQVHTDPRLELLWSTPLIFDTQFFVEDSARSRGPRSRVLRLVMGEEDDEGGRGSPHECSTHAALPAGYTSLPTTDYTPPT